MAKKLHKLSSLSVSKVSLVPKGSNPLADVVFYKHDVSRATFSEIMAGEVLRGTLYKIYDACYTMQDAISSAMYGNGDSASEVRESIGQFKTYVDNLLDELGTGKVKKESINLEELATTLVARHHKHVAQFSKETPMKKAFKDMTPEEQAAHVVELERQLAEKNTPPPDPKPTTPAISEEVERALPAEVREFIAQERAKSEATAAANTALAQTVERLNDESEQRRYEDIARAEIPHLKGTVQEKATMLRGLAKAGQTQYDATMVQLKAANAALAASVLVEIGRGPGAAPAADTAAGKIDAIAKEIRQADSKLTHAQAYERACQQNTDLYREMREERFATNRA